MSLFNYLIKKLFIKNKFGVSGDFSYKGKPNLLDIRTNVFEDEKEGGTVTVGSKQIAGYSITKMQRTYIYEFNVGNKKSAENALNSLANFNYQGYDSCQEGGFFTLNSTMYDASGNELTDYTQFSRNEEKQVLKREEDPTWSIISLKLDSGQSISSYDDNSYDSFIAKEEGKTIVDFLKKAAKG